ncbi:hypothetical protein PG985_010059 [Apiospora marii]|uniref:Uncharacterized protein n=1 Tax=Apiospora marii TaxID=335849 RepID=A0ABR1RL34_9PEZI
MDAPFTYYTDIQCVYPISGNYGLAPRFLYYFLVFFVALFQRYPKLTAGAAAYCISYAGATAVHAVLLASIAGSSTPSLADDYVSVNTTSSVWVAGRVLDHDVDATFVVVGVGCLSSLIFAVSTAAYKKMAPARSIIVLWGLLMLAGVVACLVNFYGVDEGENGPFLQPRFCPPSVDDDLPLSSISAPILGRDWNETVWTFFGLVNVSNNHATGDTKCLYPCLASSQMMRDQPDIQIVSFNSLLVTGSGFPVYQLMTIITWGALPLTVLAGFVLVVGQWAGWFPPADSLPFAGYASLWENLRGESSEGDRLSPHKQMKSVKSVIVTVLQVYALIITPILMVILIVFMEWSLAPFPQSETVWHVGQWSPLVGVGFVFIAILVSGEWTPSNLITIFRLRIAQLIWSPITWILRQTYLRPARNGHGVC